MFKRLLSFGWVELKPSPRPLGRWQKSSKTWEIMAALATRDNSAQVKTCTSRKIPLNPKPYLSRACSLSNNL